MRKQENVIYQRALKFLYRRTNYETFKSIPYSEMENSLLRVREFLAYLGNPDRRFTIVHVAGTKGKGTVCHALDRIYRAAGYRVGLFTSPHLDDLTERFQIDGKNCDKTFFGETMRALVERWNEYAELKKANAFEGGAGFASDVPTQKMSFFEWSLVLAIALFARAGVDVAILEVGMGGKYDATNACDSDVSVLTSISYDHCEQLGNTLVKIAGEKLGIVKTNAPLVSGVGFANALRHEPLTPIAETQDGVEEDMEDDNEEVELNSAQDVGAFDASGGDDAIDDALDAADSEREDAEDVADEIADGDKNDAAIVEREREDAGSAEGVKNVESDWTRQAQALLTIDPQTQIAQADLETVKALARERANEFGAPFYQVDAVSPMVRSFPAPPFDSVRRWNFEIALKVVDVLANRAEYPSGRLNPSGRSGKLTLPVSREAILQAAENFQIPARFEVVSTEPIVVVDGAHNRASVAAFMQAVKERYPERKIRILFASTIGKDTRGMIAEIAPVADEIVLTERDKDERAEPVAELIQTVEELLDETCSDDSPIRRKFRVVPDFHAYLADYCTRPNPGNDVLCAIGSFYFAAEVRRDILDR